MLPIDSLTEQELNRRFDSLPDKLKEALTSERNTRIVHQICDNNRIIDGEKRLMIEQLVGLVMLGIIHYYDMGLGIDEALSVNNPKFSNSIADEINIKIFSPIKNELENNYHPLTSTTSDVRPLKIIPQTPGGELGANIAPPAPPVPPVPQAPAAPTVGWSRSTSAQPVVKLTDARPPAAPAPAPMTSPTPSKLPSPASPAPKPAAPASQPGSMDEFERLAAQRRGAGGAQGPGAAEPPPIMIHEYASSKVQSQAPDFRLELPSRPIDLGKRPAGPAPIKSAVLEFGATPVTAPKPGPATTRVVHYTDYKSPSPENPVTPTAPPATAATQGPRLTTEITGATSISAATTSPPATPKPPSPPKPMQPPQPQPPRPAPPPPMPPR